MSSAVLLVKAHSTKKCGWVIEIRKGRRVQRWVVGWDTYALSKRFFSHLRTSEAKSEVLSPSLERMKQNLTMATHVDTNNTPDGSKCPCCSNPWQAATAGFFCQICDEEQEKSTAVRGLDRSNMEMTWQSNQMIIFMCIRMVIGWRRILFRVDILVGIHFR